MRRYSFIAAVFTLALCGCNRVDNLDSNEKTAAPTVYHLSIQASMDSQTKGVTFDPDGERVASRFEVGDKVYVYNKTQDALARHKDEDDYLATPIILTSAGQTCTLEGDLTFFKLNGYIWEEITPKEGDEYCLFYQLNDADFVQSGANYYPRFDYSVQNGSATSASQCDFAAVTDIQLELSGLTLTVPDDVRFTNLQSMFRQKLTFKNSASETVTPIIKSFSIDTENGTLIYYHNPTIDISSSSPEKYEAYSIDIDDNPVISDGNIYLALAFYYPDEASKNDKLILTATDTEGNVYRCIKNVPAGGFQNGKYYYGNCTLEWDHQISKPKVTYTETGVDYEYGPDTDGQYDFCTDPMKMTICGDSQGYRFYFNNYPAFVTLTGSGDPVSASWAGQNAFIESDDDLTVILDCNYLIDNSADHYSAIDCGGKLKLMTSGGTQTLTVITNDDGSNAYGIYGASNYDAWMYTNISDLAVDNFTVVLKSTTPGPDEDLDGNPDYYTWVYTVSPATE